MGKISGTGRIDGTNSNDEITGSEQADEIYGFGGRDVLFGRGGNDVLYGGEGNDHLLGDLGDDLMFGGAGKDVLFGSQGADQMWGGGGADIFDYRWGTAGSSSKADQTGTIYGVDVIHDFEQGLDRIDLSNIDANALTKVISRSTNEAFAFIGESAFSGRPGELRYEHAEGATYIHADVDGDAQADMTIALSGIYAVLASDFVL